MFNSSYVAGGAVRVSRHHGAVQILGELRNTPLEGPVFLQLVQVVDAVHETGIPVVRGALSSSKLTKVVWNILQCNPHHQHAQQGGQTHVDPQYPGQAGAQQPHRLSPQQSQHDEGQEGEDRPAGGRDGAEDGPGGEEDGEGGEEERQEVGGAAAGWAARAGGGGGGGGRCQHRPHCVGGGARQVVLPCRVQSQVGPAAFILSVFQCFIDWQVRPEYSDCQSLDLIMSQVIFRTNMKIIY